MESPGIIYENNNVVVYKTVIIIHGSRYYVKDINGAFVAKQANYRRYPIILGVFILGLSLILSFWAPGAAWTFFFIAFGCFLYAYYMKPKYALRLKMSLGEVRPVISTRREEIEEIKDAILAAIAQNY